MSYFTLPKINTTITVNPIESTNILKPYISHSLLNYYTEMHKQIEQYLNINDLSYNSYEEITRIINPYEYIFSKVPGSKFSVSKLKPKTSSFYDFLEVSTTLNIFDSYKFSSIKTLHLTNNNDDTIECLEILRENFNDEMTCHDEINDEIIKTIGDEKFDFIFFETKYNDNVNEYTIYLIKIILIIFKNQLYGGSCIIKINNIFHKPIIDILYLLSSLYDKTYILKPNTSNITTFDKYVICKKLQNNETTNLRFNYFKLIVFLKKLEGKNIVSILDNNIPYYFITKLNDINIIVGQQQIESLDLIINIFKNKNKEEKIETIKKTNIQKSVAWCEKYKIPCNKFSEKTNIFLPLNKEQNDFEKNQIQIQN